MLIVETVLGVMKPKLESRRDLGLMPIVETILGVLAPPLWTVMPDQCDLNGGQGIGLGSISLGFGGWGRAGWGGCLA